MFYLFLSVTYFILFLFSRNILLAFYFCYNLFFMALVPFLEGGSGISYWGLPQLNPTITFFVDLIILSQAILIFLLANKKHNLIVIVPKPKNLSFLIFIQIVCASYIVYKFDFDLLNILFRAGEFQGSYNSQIDYLVMTFIRILIFNLGFYIFIVKKRFGILFLLISVFMLSPFSMSRALTGSLYLSLIFLYFSLRSGGLKFHKFAILASMMAFPLFDFFRQLFISNRSIFDYFASSAILNGQFDSHQIIVNVISDNLFLWGTNILGAFLFFVPRSIWASKPISSGAFIPEYYNLILNNISAPFIIELVLAFGLIGLLFFPFIYTLIIEGSNKYASKNIILYFQIASLSVMLLRGSLMTTVSFLFCIIFSWIIITTITRLR